MTKITKVLSYCLILNSFVLFSQSVSIAPSIDTYIDASSSSTSFAAATSLKIKHTFSKSVEKTAWIKFSIASFPTDKTQVLLKLVKTNGDEGNLSLFGANGNLATSATWNSPPTTTSNFYYGGLRKGTTFYFDVTEYVQSQLTNSTGFVAFKIFTNSIIVNAIELASSEATDITSRPELIFYTTKKYDIPLFSMHSTVTIPTEKGNYTGELVDKKQSLNEVRDIYGGWENAKSTATGYFRVEKDCMNTWHIIDPDGNMFYSAGLNTVETGGGINMPQQLKNLGLNTMGSWSDETIKNFAYTPRFNVLVNFKNSNSTIKATYDKDVMPVFETGFKAFCQNLAQTELPPYLTDKWVLGYFLDNELVFHKNQLSISLTLATTNAEYLEADKWMKAKYGNSYSKSSVTSADEIVYQGYVVETYFKIVSEAFRAVDPNHMLIGTRFHAGVKYIPEIFAAAGKYMDILSINYYSRFEPEEDVMDMWLSSGQKPFIITEFYTKGNDAGVGNADGAGWSVSTQTDRANWYENWMLKLLKNKGSVGFHWFRYLDKPSDDSNKGLYSYDYKIFQTLADSFTKVCTNIYTLRSQILYGNYNYNDAVDCDAKICGTNNTCDVILATGNKFIADNSESQVYPNPAGQVITIANSNGSVYEIHNLTGQKVQSGSIKSEKQEVYINQLNAGIYLVKIIGNLGKNSVFKIIKK